MHDQTITLFNYSKKDNSWYATVIDGCYFYVTGARMHTANGLSNQDNSCLIIYTEKDASIKGLTYAKPKEYQRLDDKSGYFTMTTEMDFFVCGLVEADGAIDDSDYESGFYHYMNSTYDDVLMIQSAVHYSSLIPHFEVVGK